MVWSTKERQPLITPERAVLVERVVRSSCRERGAVVHGFGWMPDHIHVAVGYPPSIAIAELVRVLKGGSSHLVNHSVTPSGDPVFAWQGEHGALSFGKRSLDQVVSYVESQAERHASGKTIAKLEQFSAATNP